jgi:hypothetical protein
MKKKEIDSELLNYRALYQASKICEFFKFELLDFS